MSYVIFVTIAASCFEHWVKIYFYLSTIINQTKLMKELNVIVNNKCEISVLLILTQSSASLESQHKIKIINPLLA